MDASASPKDDAAKNDDYNFFLKIGNTEFPIRQKNTVIKYTKLPELDFDAVNGLWPKYSHSLQPRLRRIIALEDPYSSTTRSLKTNLIIAPKVMTTNLTKRKIVTISEDDEYDLHPKFSSTRDTNRSSTKKTSNRSIGADLDKETKQFSHRSTSRQMSLSRYLKESKPSAKSCKAFEKKENITKSKYKSKPLNINTVISESIRPRNIEKNDSVISSKCITSSRSSISKKCVTKTENEKEMSIIKDKLYGSLKNNPTTKKCNEKFKVSRSPPRISKSKPSFLQESKKYKPLQTVIHVPLEEKYLRQNVMTRCIRSSETDPANDIYKSDKTTDTDIVIYKDINVGSEPLPYTIDQGTDACQIGLVQNVVQNADKESSLTKETYDDLHIPNVSLKTDKSACREKSLDIQCISMPNLQVPSCQMTSNRNEKSSLDTHYCKSTSYIISRATLTYKTKQQINFHVVGSNDNAYSNQSPSPISYPINVVSVFKEESSPKNISKDIPMDDKNETKSRKDFKNCINEIKSLDCSYVSNSDKLMKPSDIISTIRVNNGLLQNEYICEQFQRELNFIDSFFESLQYLESCSFSEKSFNNDKIDVLVNKSSLLTSSFDVKNLEYKNFLAKFENGANNGDTDTMASKNLFLLNILIRDEQRRAKNLLFVLKRREDALKDFTKSQILYLESKKKQENTDISALKKKQRGALLKLQTECGEMQRMRKALLTLSEKRKVALMKTKKDLEQKLRNNLDVDQIIIGKKKQLKRSSERTSAPLKCFDLSSSGCEDTSTPLYSSDSTSSSSEVPAPNPITSVERGIQTNETVLESLSVDQSTETAGEYFVAVDGGYLNILFQNLSLPQIFNGGKQYEVNEEALRNIVNSTNSRNTANGSVAEKIMDEISIRDSDKSSTPSTARSLVEEFDQYYKGFVEDEKSDEDGDFKTPPQEGELADAIVPASECSIAPCEVESVSTISTQDSTQTVVRALDETYVCEVLEEVKSPVESSATAPLPMPAGAPDVPDTTVADTPSWLPSRTSIPSLESSSASSESLCDLISSIPSLSAPIHTEAEELRRQQFAIEQEIKELEQQQCQLLVVREIPDKPPPPYTPPGDARARPPRPFVADELAKQQIRTFVDNPDIDVDSTDAFDVFVHDFCQESLAKHKPEQSDKPWDSCNLLPQNPPPDKEEVVETTSSELVEVLAAVTPVTVSRVSSRRSDHIDDLLFAEWRRVEPEWTSLHTDEASVKNQLFEIIFQRILTETFDEYKQTVREIAD